MKRYHVSISGYEGLTTFNETELKAFLKEETNRARRYFGTAVCHKSISDDRTWFEITSRKDKRSSRWLFLTAYHH